MTRSKTGPGQVSGPLDQPVPVRPAGASLPGAAREPEPDPRVAELEARLEESQDQHLRLAADFDNFRKRSRQERLDVIQHASQGLVEDLLPVLDDLHRTLDHAPESSEDSWLKGFELSVQKLEEVLAGQGVEGIEAVGRPFDPKLHEAIGAEDSDAPEDTVLQELRRGYRMHDRVLRPSLVKLARPALPAQE